MPHLALVRKIIDDTETGGSLGGHFTALDVFATALALDPAINVSYFVRNLRLLAEIKRLSAESRLQVLDIADEMETVLKAREQISASSTPDGEA